MPHGQPFFRLTFCLLAMTCGLLVACGESPSGDDDADKQSAGPIRVNIINKGREPIDQVAIYGEGPHQFGPILFGKIDGSGSSTQNVPSAVLPENLGLGWSLRDGKRIDRSLRIPIRARKDYHGTLIITITPGGTASIKTH